MNTNYEQILEEYLETELSLKDFCFTQDNPEELLAYAKKKFWSVQKQRWITLGLRGMPKDKSEELSDIRQTLYLKINDYESNLTPDELINLLRAYKDFAQMGGNTSVDKKLTDTQAVKRAVMLAIRKEKADAETD